MSPALSLSFQQPSPSPGSGIKTRKMQITENSRLVWIGRDLKLPILFHGQGHLPSPQAQGLQGAHRLCGTGHILLFQGTPVPPSATREQPKPTQNTGGNCPTHSLVTALNTDLILGRGASWYHEEELLEELIAGLAVVGLQGPWGRAAAKGNVGTLGPIAAVVVG